MHSCDPTTFSQTQQALAEFHETRKKQKADEARWDRYRQEAAAPWQIVLALSLVGSVGMIVLAATLLANPSALRSPFILLVVPLAGGVQLMLKLAQRREKALALAIKQEAPELYVKLKAEQLVR
jgi:hypothetical protein